MSSKKEKDPVEAEVLDQSKLIELAGGDPLLFLKYYNSLLQEATRLVGLEKTPPPENLFHLALGLAAVLGQVCAVSQVPPDTITDYIKAFHSTFAPLVDKKVDSPEAVVAVLDEGPVPDPEEEKPMEGLNVLDWSSLKPKSPGDGGTLPN